MNAIEFICWENDKALEIQLEPEAFCYTVHPGNTLKFIAKNCTSTLRWTLRIIHDDQGIQLFPDPPQSYDCIEIYMNETLIESISSS